MTDNSDTRQVSALERRTIAEVKLYLYTYIFLGQVLYQFDRSNMGFVNLTMSKDLVLTAKDFGLTSGILGFSAFLMQIPAGMAFDKWGPRRLLTVTMVLWGLIVVGEGLVTSSTQFIVLRFMLGIFEASFPLGVVIIINNWFRGKHHGAAMATLMLGLAAANIAGGPLSGWILDKSFWGLAGWRSRFVLDGGLMAIWALLSLLILCDSPETTSWLKRAERSCMAQYLSEYEAEKRAYGTIQRATLWETLKNREVLTLLLAFAFSGWIASTFTFFIPTLLKRAAAGVSLEYVGILMMGPYIVYAIVGQIWGRTPTKRAALALCLAPSGIRGGRFALSRNQDGNRRYDCHLFHPGWDGRLLCQFLVVRKYGC